MGRLEKIVVVTVLFIVAVVLAASMYGDAGAPRDPDGSHGGLLARGDGPSRRVEGPMDEILAGGDGDERAADRESTLEREHAPTRASAPAGAASAQARPAVPPPTGFSGLDGEELDDAELGRGALPALPTEAPVGEEATAGGGRLLAGGALPEVGGDEATEGAPANGRAQPVGRDGEVLPAAAVVPLRGDGYLVTTQGLLPSEYDDAYLLYTWRRGDSFRSLAERYYGHAKYEYRVAEANEGYRSSDFRPGQQIWIAARATSASLNEGGTDEPVAGRVYVVQDGDILSQISVDVYQSAKHWRRILEANRHQMATDRDLRAGMELIIPPLE